MRTFLSTAMAALAVLSGGAMARGALAGALKVSQAWSLPVPFGAPTAVGYATITNTGAAPDRLVGADTPDAIRVEIHQMSMQGAIMRMRPATGGLVLPPGQTVTLGPGGYHLMLIGPKRGFAVGDHIRAILRFEYAGSVRVDFRVQLAPPRTDDAHAPVNMH